MSKLSNDPQPINLLGGGYKLISEKRKQLTVALAKQYLDLPKIGGERRIDQKQVATYVRHMTRKGGGTMNWGSISQVQCFCEEDGVTYGLNSQHVSQAVIIATDLLIENKQLKPNGRINAPVLFQEYRAKTLHDVHQLYSTYDTGKKRSEAHKWRVFMADDADFENLLASMRNLIPAAVKLWQFPKQTDRSGVIAEDVYYSAKTKMKPLIIKVSRCLSTSKGDIKYMLRAPVLAAMLATFDWKPTIAQDFWLPILRGEGFDHKEDPRKVLRAALMGQVINLGTGSRSEKKRVTSEYMYRECIIAWNAWRAKERRKVLKPNMNTRRPALK